LLRVPNGLHKNPAAASVATDTDYDDEDDEIMTLMIMMMMYNSRVMGYSACQDLQEHKVVHENESNGELKS
jgi:hypothetical protein